MENGIKDIEKVMEKSLKKITKLYIGMLVNGKIIKNGYGEQFHPNLWVSMS